MYLLCRMPYRWEHPGWVGLGHWQGSELGCGRPLSLYFLQYCLVFLSGSALISYLHEQYKSSPESHTPLPQFSANDVFRWFSPFGSISSSQQKSAENFSISTFPGNTTISPSITHRAMARPCFSLPFPTSLDKAEGGRGLFTPLA